MTGEELQVLVKQVDIFQKDHVITSKNLIVSTFLFMSPD